MAELTLDIIQNLLNNSLNYDINIPNLYENPYIIVPTLLGNQQYYFEYYWNNRAEKAYLSIFKIQNEERIYYIKNVLLLKDLVISKKIKNNDWVGFLVFQSQDGTDDVFYTIKDISTRFKLFYAYTAE